MSRFFFAAATITVAAVVACSGRRDDNGSVASPVAPSAAVRRIAAAPGESRLANIRQLTYGGENAEAYFSPDGSWITFQSTRDGRACDQQFVMRSDGSDLRRVSDGTGKTTCGYFIDGGKRLLWSSTHAVQRECPARPDPSQGYVWGLDPFDIYTSDLDGGNRKALTSYGVYTTEATVSPDGRTIVFTSLKDGDLDIYTMNVDGTNIRRLTTTPGYDGGAFFSPDGKRIVYRSWHPTGDSLAVYLDLLARRLVRPNKMEVWTMNADGSDQRQVTNLGGANFAPFYTPDGQRIIFSSNHKNPRSQNFDLYLVNVDGTGLEQVTTDATFDGFPMFSRDGRHLIWASNRNAPVPRGTDLFIAEWKP
jgi:Tol biopolymer transport system component